MYGRDCLRSIFIPANYLAHNLIHHNLILFKKINKMEKTEMDFNRFSLGKSVKMVIKYAFFMFQQNSQ